MKPNDLTFDVGRFPPAERSVDYAQMDLPLRPRFDGSDYDPDRDDARLTGQLLRIVQCMNDSRWRTLPDIERETGAPAASISAQLRHLRKPRFGGHTVNKDYMGNGVWQYQLVMNKK
tara:strand:- start:1185 stop:1535 length:351 start_codon:yes stop_codon:yes gene_type:complete